MIAASGLANSLVTARHRDLPNVYAFDSAWCHVSCKRYPAVLSGMRVRQLCLAFLCSPVQIAGCQYASRSSSALRFDSLFHGLRATCRALPHSSYHAAATAAGGAHVQMSARSGRDRPKRRRSNGSDGIAKGALSMVGSARPAIQWYPGHIAKAERTLKDSLKLVDVVVEVRDCRIPIATAHPSVPEWLGSKAHVLAMGRADLVPDTARAEWKQYLLDTNQNPRFIDAKRGKGVEALKKLAVDAGAAVNEKRRSRGLLPRPVRCLVIGYPNVGKSALINRLVGRKAAKSANKPGVTRNFQWIRISESIELLDMPGIIPAKLLSQDTAARLAICDDIGQAAYDHQIAAVLMIEELKRVAANLNGYFEIERFAKRYGVDARHITGEEYVHQAADRLYKGDLERTAMRLLTDFRSGELGPVALESPSMLKGVD